MKRIGSAVLAIVSLSVGLATAQQPTKPKLTTVEEAVAASARLAGSSGPRSVNWIDGGARFAYTITNPTTRAEEIRRYDPATLADELLLDTRTLMLPGSREPLQYRSFQWARDSKHLLFQTNFRPIFRRSGLADFYLYSMLNKTLELVAKDARTAELSPDGTKAGYDPTSKTYMSPRRS